MPTVQSPQPNPSPRRSFLIEVPVHKIPQARAALIERMAKDLIAHAILDDRDDAIRLLHWLGYSATDVGLLIGEVMHWAQISVLMKEMGQS